MSQAKFASEVELIYEGLTMVEKKCEDGRGFHAARTREQRQSLHPEYWKDIIELHGMLLHEYYDYFLASQHPLASRALRRLAEEYRLPARMWENGICSFLELLREGLPQTRDYMLASIHPAYQMLTLLYETVPAFKQTWMQHLGDLARYRMAIEHEDIQDREMWAQVARTWYYRAADKIPTVGRLYHHLAILARLDHAQQLYYYTRSMTSVEPFRPACKSILDIFGPYILRESRGGDKINIPWTFEFPCPRHFVVTHAYQFIIPRKKELKEGCVVRSGKKSDRGYDEMFFQDDPVQRHEKIIFHWIR